MGSDAFYPEERPVRETTVGDLLVDEHPVTNAEFRRFVKDTGHVTVAEQEPDPADFPDADRELLVPGSQVFTGTPGPVPLDDWTRWWSWVPGADWRHPLGPDSTSARSGTPPRRSRRLGGRHRVRGLGRMSAANRSRMGACGARRPRWCHLRLGGRCSTGRAHDGQHLAGSLPLREPLAATTRSHLSRPQLPAQRFRAIRRHRKRLGVDGYSLDQRPRRPPRRVANVLLRAHTGGQRTGQVRHQGRITSVRTRVLPPIPTRRTARARSA